MRFSSLVLFMLTLSSLACGTRIDAPDSSEEQVVLPPLLKMQSMSSGAAVTRADDVDLTTPGLQVRVVIQVNDEAWDRHLPVVNLMNARGERYSARTRTDGFNRIAVFERVGVAASVEGIENTWLVFSDAKDTSVEDSDAELIEDNSFSFSHSVLGVGDVDFPFACSQVQEVQDSEAMWAADNDDCVVLLGDLVVTELEDVELPPLPSVVDVQGDVVVDSNPNLRTLRALSQIGRVQGDLRIQRNGNLPADEAQAVVQEIGEENIRGRIVIDDNGGF